MSLMLCIWRVIRNEDSEKKIRPSLTYVVGLCIGDYLHGYLFPPSRLLQAISSKVFMITFSAYYHSDRINSNAILKQHLGPTWSWFSSRQLPPKTMPRPYVKVLVELKCSIHVFSLSFLFIIIIIFLYDLLILCSQSTNPSTSHI